MNRHSEITSLEESIWAWLSECRLSIDLTCPEERARTSPSLTVADRVEGVVEADLLAEADVGQRPPIASNAMADPPGGAKASGRVGAGGRSWPGREISPAYCERWRAGRSCDRWPPVIDVSRRGGGLLRSWRFSRDWFGARRDRRPCARRCGLACRRDRCSRQGPSVRSAGVGDVLAGTAGGPRRHHPSP